MKTLFLLGIRLYWIVVPKNKRRKCIFRTTCSQYVYQATIEEGFFKGLIALRYRFLNCRSGYQIFENSDGSGKMMVLQNGQILPEKEISERFIKSH
ncbi:membrane protein insertion efficiency factor YidD [Pedobacter metabolipauper]|uniref:membrane protein insertion efficiency factor YidD n=1 Tax=Pedobacter metabolipauper TaxID=425513 RepID=UPI00106114CD